MQYSLFVFYEIMIIASFWIKFVKNFEMQNYPFFLHIYFGFYFSEIISLAWWINFYIHLRSYSKIKDLSDIVVKSVKRKEFALLMFLIFIFSIFAISFLSLQIAAIAMNWNSWRPFYKFESCKDPWWTMGYAFKTIFQLLIIFWLYSHLY